MLEADARQNLLADLRVLVEQHGGVVTSQYVSRLYVAHKR